MGTLRKPRSLGAGKGALPDELAKFAKTGTGPKPFVLEAVSSKYGLVISYDDFIRNIVGGKGPHEYEVREFKPPRPARIKLRDKDTPYLDIKLEEITGVKSPPAVGTRTVEEYDELTGGHATGPHLLTGTLVQGTEMKKLEGVDGITIDGQKVTLDSRLIDSIQVSTQQE